MKKMSAIIVNQVLVILTSLMISCAPATEGRSDNTTHNANQPSSDTSLLAITVSGTDLDQLIQSDRFFYSASVGFAVSSVAIRLVVTDSSASITLNGIAIASGTDSDLIHLAVGDNTIPIVITADDETTIQTYTLVVTRSGASTFDATLSGLTIDGADMDQTFQSAQLSYTASVNYHRSTITLHPVASNSAASITINGQSADSGSAATQITLLEGNNTITLVITAEDRLSSNTYSIDITRATAANFAQQAFLKASNAERGDRFGASVALQGDTLVVGAFLEDSTASGGQGNNGADHAGAVYVFTRTNTSWTQQAYLKAPNADANDFFGYQVALDRDTLVIGAYGEDSSYNGGEDNNEVSSAGAVYVFTRTNGSWSQQAYLKASNAGLRDYFGASVGLDGDTLAVGAFLEDGTANGGEGSSGARHAGAVYVFTRSNGIWTQQAYLKASNAEAGDFFGASVGLEGDTLVIGASREDSNAIDGAANNDARHAGAVYVFTRNNGSWVQEAYLKASNADADDFFGYRVALSGDTLAVGAYKEDSTAKGDEDNNDLNDAGAVYIFTRIDGSWNQQAYLKATNADAGDSFGASVALAGDTLMVGAINEDSTASGGGSNDDYPGAGAVYVFTRSNGSWSPQTYLKANNADAYDRFGYSVALDGDTLVIGARNESSSVNGGEANNDVAGSGAVYVWQ